MIQEAIAQTAPQAGGGFDFMPLLTMGLIFVIFYFLFVRPQQKKQKHHQEMLSVLNKGDQIITTGGLIGTVVKTTDKEIILEISPGVQVRVLKGMVAHKVGDEKTTASEGSKTVEKEKKAPVQKRPTKK